MTRRAWLVPTALMTVATVAFPCGGSMAYWVDGPLQPAASYGERGLYPVVDMLESMTRDEIKFLPGLVRADSTRFAALVGRAAVQSGWWRSDTAVRVPEPTAAALEAALLKGDVESARREARALVSAIMALPLEADSARDAGLRLAVETIELAPLVAVQPVAARRAAFLRLAEPVRRTSFDSLALLLASMPQHPRRASLEYAALRSAVRTGIPDETRDEIHKQVPAARWDSLQAAHRDWLSRYPDHPYATLVQLQRMRLFYLASQNDSAWRTAIAIYPAHPVRAAAEMRHMLLTQALPQDDLLTDPRIPLELRVALIGNLRPTTPVWTAMMQVASARPRDGLRENLEERLLAALATDTVPLARLPAGFPAWRPTASPLWRYLWAASLLRAGKPDEALPYTTVPITVAEDTMLAPDAVSLAARIHLARRDFLAAAATPGLDEWTRRYIVQVLTPDSLLPTLASAPNRAVAREAALLLASRAAQMGRWSEAAALVRPVDAARSTLYTRLGTLARDTASNAGLLRFATAIGGASGRLFPDMSRYFYRGMMNRDYALNPEWVTESSRWDLPWSRAEERAWMFRALREGSERYLALRVYASYFARPGVTVTERRAAVRSADRLYRQLLATDPSRSDAGYWADSLPPSAEARAIRRAGRQ